MRLLLDRPPRADEPASSARHDVDHSRATKDHVAEVRAFLAASQEVVRELSRRIESASARVLATDAKIERFAKHSQRFTAAIRGAEAVLASVSELERIVADLERARALLEREHAKFVDASRSIPVPTLITDQRAIVCDANAAAAEALGVDERGLLGRRLIAFVARQDTRRFRAFSQPLWDDPCDEEREVVLRIRPRGRPTVLAAVGTRRARSHSAKDRTSMEHRAYG